MEETKNQWKIIQKSKKEIGLDDIVEILLKNRGAKTKKEKTEFINPPDPSTILLKDLKLNVKEVNKAVVRIKKAMADSEDVIVYGDYDADGICATACLWETLYSLGLKAAPYIPERFNEGYGLNSETIKKLKNNNPNIGLIISVDNGIVAYDAISTAKKVGIDIIITDHHEKGEKYPNALSVIHTTLVSGSALAWFFSGYLLKKLRKNKLENNLGDGLELAAIGTIADQMPLILINRSIVKLGLSKLKQTKRPGLFSLYKKASLERESISTYSVNYLIAPRLNAMGRLEHAMDSLRLLCTKSPKRAQDLSNKLEKVNSKRQDIVNQVVNKAILKTEEKKWQGVIVVYDKDFHEGVIGLAASKLVEKHYRPVIVISKGKKVSKGSGRSIEGFDLIKHIRKHKNLLIEAGGHKMAAGFSINSNKIEKFVNKISKSSKAFLDSEILTRKLYIDLELKFEVINLRLVEKLKEFEPFGIGNPQPTFISRNLLVLDLKAVGKDKNHFKLILGNGKKTFDAIYFDAIKKSYLPEKGSRVEAVYSIEENVWNGNTSIQLKIKDMKPI